MKRSFQHVSAADGNAAAAITSEDPVAASAIADASSPDANFIYRPRKCRALCRVAPSPLDVSTHTNALTACGSLVLTPLSPLSARRRCGGLEIALQEEALLCQVLTFLDVRDHQIVRQTSRAWRRRVQTLVLDRLDLSTRSSPVTTQTLDRACQGVLQSYSRVRQLDLSGQRSLTDRDLLVLTSCFWAQLEELVADDCLALSDIGLLAVLNAQSLKLRAVSVRRCKGITGEHFAAQTSPAQQLTGSHPSLTSLNLDNTSVSHAFITRLETRFPTLQHLGALHTPAHRAFFQQDATLNNLLRELQMLVANEMVELPLLSALLDEFHQWRRRQLCNGKNKTGAFARTLVASTSRALLEVPLLLTTNSDILDGTTDQEDESDLALVSPLLFACASGRTRVIPALLEVIKSDAAFDLEITDANGFSPLNLAVANGLTEAARLLLRAGAQVDTRAQNLATPLYLASERGWDVLVDLLLDVNARRDCAIVGGATALCAAAKNGHRSTVLRLLAAEKQAEDEAQLEGRAYTQRLRTQHLVQALFLACEGGHTPVVSDLLLLTELDANVLMDENVAPLYLACQMGHVAIVSLLLARGADPSFRRPQGGVSCLYIAAQEGHDHIVRQLVRAGADVHAQMNDLSTALHIAARMGRNAVTRALLRSGARLNDQTRSGLTALYIASEEGHLALVQFLLNASAGRDIQTHSGATALFAAVHRGHAAVVRALLQGGASAVLPKHNGTSPLDAAVLLGDVEVTRLLLRFGARVGGLALHFAERRPDASRLQALLRTRYYTQHFLQHAAHVSTVSIPPAVEPAASTTESDHSATVVR
ncbi:hypothetical protein BBJ28_00014716 [Nothophytophthora sp. Chile5]|nr:hypothetical protein BBJ28_00014716 [Nothophytophthora sp. Chile5]